MSRGTLQCRRVRFRRWPTLLPFPLSNPPDRSQAEAARLVTTAARLIAPVVDHRSWEAGYEWVVDQLRHDHPQIASEVLVVKALAHLKHRQFDRAIEQLKAFERKEKHHKARAATNLAFLYLLEGDVEQATRYASLAVKHDRYNAKALVNMGERAHAGPASKVERDATCPSDV